MGYYWVILGVFDDGSYVASGKENGNCRIIWGFKVWGYIVMYPP